MNIKDLLQLQDQVPQPTGMQMSRSPAGNPPYFAVGAPKISEDVSVKKEAKKIEKKLDEAPRFKALPPEVIQQFTEASDSQKDIIRDVQDRIKSIKLLSKEEPFQRIKSGIDSKKELLQNLGQFTQDPRIGDYAASYVNFLRGGKLELPKQSDAQQQTLQNILGVQESIQKDEKALSDALLKGSEVEKIGKLQNTLESLSKTTFGKTDKGGSKLDKVKYAFEKEIRSSIKDFEKDTTKFFNQLDQFDSQIQTGNLSAVKATLGMLARAISGEVGVLTNKDIGRVLPPTIGQTVAEFEAYITDNVNAKMSPATVEALKDLVSRARTTAQENAIEELQKQKRMYGTSSVALDTDARVDEIFDVSIENIVGRPQRSKERVERFQKEAKVKEKTSKEAPKTRRQKELESLDEEEARLKKELGL